jgi:hypothetical protein
MEDFENGASRHYKTDGKQTLRSEIQKSKILTTDEFTRTIPQFDVFKVLKPDSQILVQAPRRSGKTTLVEDMIGKWRTKNRVDLVMLFSKSNAGFPNISQKYRFRSMEPALSQLMETQIKVKQANRKRKKDKIHSRVICIFDDQIDGSRDLRTNNLLTKMATLGRHAGDSHSSVMCIYLSQHITAIPPVIRRNMDIVISLKISSRLERKLFVEEFLTLKSGRGGLTEAYNLFDIVNSQDFKAIIVNTTHSNKYDYKDYVSQYVATPYKSNDVWSGTQEDMKIPFAIYF